jgi:CheY-like chemotaxis protein
LVGVVLVGLLGLVVVVLVWVLGVLVGYTATQAIRQTETDGARHTPIIAMTANAMREDRARCLDAGMDGFIPKPIALEELETAMECWIPYDVKPGADSGRTPNPDDYVFRTREQASMMSKPGEARLPEQAVPAKSFAADPALVAALAAQFASDPMPQPSGDSASVDLSVLDNLAGMTEGGDEFVGRLIETFVSDTTSRLVTLHVALDAGDASMIERTGHALKGSSGNMGATAMAALGAALQGVGQKQDLEGAGALIEDMEAEFARVRAALERAFPSHAFAA